MNTETATSATPEAVCSTAMLGPVRRALDGLAFAAHQAGEYEKQLGDSADVRDWIEYVMCEVAAEREAAVAAERERCAKLCEEVESQAWALWKTTADPIEQGRNIGAQHCADAIRA